MDIIEIIGTILGIISLLIPMAVFQNSQIGAGSGSVGGTTWSSWKGRHVARAKPFKVHNPKTNAQTAQRVRFADIGYLSKKGTWILNLLAAPWAKSMFITPNNVFMRTNQKNGAYVRGTSLPFTPTVLASKIQWASGGVVQVGAPQAPTALTGTVTVTWTDNTNPANPKCQATDNVCLVIMDHLYQTTPDDPSLVPPDAMIGATVARSDATITAPTTSQVTGHTIDVYIVTVQWSTTIPFGVITDTSDSFHCGTTTVV